MGPFRGCLVSTGDGIIEVVNHPMATPKFPREAAAVGFRRIVPERVAKDAIEEATFAAHGGPRCVFSGGFTYENIGKMAADLGKPGNFRGFRWLIYAIGW